MDTETFYMICFDSSQRAIQLEKELKADYSDIRLVPIPPEIRVSCGIGIKVSSEDYFSIKNRVRQEMIYLVTKNGHQRSVQKCETI